MTGLRSTVRRLKLASEWSRRGGRVAVASGPLPARLKWQMQNAGFSHIELPGPSARSSIAGPLWAIAEDQLCRNLVIDDFSPDLVAQVAGHKPSGSQLILLGVPRQHDGEPILVDFATDHRAVFAVASSPEQSRSRRSSASAQSNRKQDWRLLADLSRTNADLGRQITGHLMMEMAGTDGPGLDIVSPFAGGWLSDLDCPEDLLGRVSIHRNPDRVAGHPAWIRLAFCSDPEEFFQLASDGIASVLLVNRADCCRELHEMTDFAPLPVVVACEDTAWQEPISRIVSLLTRRSSLVARHAECMRRLIDDQGVMRLCDAVAGLSQPASRRHTA